MEALEEKFADRPAGTVRSKILSAVLSAALALFLLSISVAIPILIRDAYYMQIDALQIPERSGYSRETIREAYDHIIDYCTKGGEAAGIAFNTGQLSYTDSGKAHFDDVERLFHLDFVVAGCSGFVLAAFLIASLLARRKKTRIFRVHRFLGLGPAFWGPSVLIGVFTAAGIYAAVDFEGFFVFFHHVFFPGKDNWIFDPDKDEILRILPEEVFANFGLIILGILLILCAACIAGDLVWKKRRG